MTWTPPLEPADLAHVAELIAKHGAAHIEVTEAVNRSRRGVSRRASTSSGADSAHPSPSMRRP
jgi:hypothetical protein